MAIERQSVPSSCVTPAAQMLLFKQQRSAYRAPNIQYMLQKLFECKMYILNNATAIQSKPVPLLPMTYQIGKIATMTQSWRIQVSRILQSRRSKQTNENVRRKIHILPRQRKWPAGGLSDIQYSSMQIKASLESPTEKNKNLPNMTFIRPTITTLLGLWWKWGFCPKLIFI